jgi:hypothetical protein
MPPKTKQTIAKRKTRQKTLEELAQLSTTPNRKPNTHKRQTHPGQPTSTSSSVLSQSSSASSTKSNASSSSSTSSSISQTVTSPTNTPPPTTPSPNTTTTTTHKKVNPNSTNRRQCKRASDDLSRSTPDRNNLSQRKHAHSTRLTLKINIPASGDPEEKIISIFSQFVGELVSADPSAAVLPWKAIHRSKGNISKMADVPENTRLLRPYLNKFYINRTPNSQFVTYPGVHIGHNMTLPEIREEIDPWLKEGFHGLFYKMLQVEDSAEIGWFLYSTKEMDAGALVDEIQDLVGIKIGLRWKIIDVDAKGKLPENQRVRALNVEVNSRNKWEAQRKFITYFGREIKDQREYPNGIRLRFVKNKRDGINSIEKGKIEKLRARQKAFLSNIASKETWDMIQLDYSNSDNEPTLRQMIMSLKSTTEIPLFHCVDLDWSGNGYIFQFSPDMKVEAECTINTLLPLLRHLHPDIDVDKYFTQDTIDRCEGYKFDPTKGVVVDTLVNDELTFIDEDNLLGFSFSTAQEEVQNESTRPDRPQALYHDDDSVSTLAKPGSSVITPSMTTNVNIPRYDSRSNDNTSITSGTSTVTMDTIHSIENRLSTLTTQLHNNDKKFEEIMQFLRTQSGANTNSPTIPNSSSNGGQTEAGDDREISGGEP